MNNLSADELLLQDEFTEALKQFTEYAVTADFDTTISQCGARSGMFASEITHRAFMVWRDQQRRIVLMEEAIKGLLTLSWTYHGDERYVLASRLVNPPPAT